MKVDKKCLYNLGYLLELIVKIWQFGEKKFFENLVNLSLFFHERSFFQFSILVFLFLERLVSKEKEKLHYT
jgi:hypothetical protein